MKIELKKVTFSERLSQETNNFAADIYADGKLIGYARNDGHGGSTYIYPNPKNRELYSKVNDYCNNLPDKIYPKTEHYKEFSVKNSLEQVVDDLFEKWIEAKYEKQEQARIKKYTKNNIVYRDGENLRMVTWGKGKYAISDLLNRADIREQIKQSIATLKAKGYEIINDNLPEDVLN